MAAGDDLNVPTVLFQMNAQIAAMAQQLNGVEAWLSDTDKRLKDVQEVVTKAKGGWYVLVLIGSGMGALVGWFGHGVAR